MLDMAACIATRRSPLLESPATLVPTFLCDNSKQMRGVVESYQWIYENCQHEILAYIHDDVEVYETRWEHRVLKEFEDPTVGLVGFGGGLSHGSPDLYKRPYQLTQLARGNYISNMRDAETHGWRFAGARDVAVLDGFALIVRRELLDKCGGWPVGGLKFHSYDYWASCMVHRLGYRVRLVGVDCHHFGGRTSTTKEYQDWLKAQGTSDLEIHQQSHQWIYEEFSDVLPWSCL